MLFLVFICFLLPIVSLAPIQIVGIFPNDDHDEQHKLLQKPERTNWCQDCVPMFRAAITVANKRGVRVRDFPILHTILETNDDGHGLHQLNLLCQLTGNETEPDIAGIIGPCTSAETRLLAPFTAHIGLPMVSYSATAAELSDIRLFPTFYRTIPSDELLAKAIVQLFDLFSWKTCTIICQKDDYGYSGVKILSETYGDQLTIKERLIFDPRSDRFHADLKNTLYNSRSRIVLVWANQSTTTRIVQHGLVAGLIGRSYVWVMTDKVDLNRFQNRSEWRLLEGLLTVMPMNRYPTEANNLLLSEAYDAWRNSSLDQSTLPKNMQQINPFALFVFDATWTLIEALNKSSFVDPPYFHSSSYCFHSKLENKTEYFKYLKETHFLGVSGDVQFSRNISNDRVGGGYYVLKNLYLKPSNINNLNEMLEYKSVMKWNEAISQWYNLSDLISIPIVWPNRSVDKYPDHPQIKGELLRILVIESPPFVIIRNMSSLQHTTNTTKKHTLCAQPYDYLETKDPNIHVSGFAADLIRELKQRMNFKFTIDVASPDISYHTLVALLADNNTQWDVIISDVTITSNRLVKVDFSIPIHENALRVIVRDNPNLFTFKLFSFLSPFSLNVWLIILLLVIYSGVLIYIFERRAISINEKGSETRTIAIGVSHALSSVVSMSGDLPLTTTASRMVTIGLYALSVILVATYTANLSSFLTLQRSLPPISGIDDIKNGRLPFSRIGIVSNSAADDYYLQNISTLYYPLATSKDIFTRLLDRTIDAAITDSTILEYAINRDYCGQLIVVGIGFAKSSFGIAMRKNWEYKQNFDMSLLSFRESGAFDKLEQKWFHFQECRTALLASNINNDLETIEDGEIPLNIMAGLFLTFLAMTVVALVLHAWHFRMVIAANIGNIVIRVRQCLSSRIR